MADINSGRETQIKYMMILLLWIVGLYVLCRTLYNRRPAESAGRAMAFTKANTVIKVLLVIPSALYSELFSIHWEMQAPFSGLYSELYLVCSSYTH